MVDQVVMNDDTPGESQEYIDKMVAKGEALQNGQPLPKDPEPGTTEERPEWLPEKFKTPADMAKAYAELEKKQGSEGKPAEEQQAGEKNDELDPKLSLEADKAEERLEDKGFKMEDLRTEYAEKGELSDGTYEKLEKAGIDRSTVDSYIEGQKALAVQVRQQGHDMVGGEENYTAMAEWARQNLTPAEIGAFNQQVASVASREMAIRGLYSKYEATAGREPARNVNGGQSNSKGDVYESRAQMVTDMNNPLYARDPAFRATVEAKLSRSSIL